MNAGRIIVRPVDVSAIIDLRHRVLREGLPRESAMFDGDDEPMTLHLAAMENGMIVGCATIMKRPHDNHPAMQLRGMAVDAKYRTRGVGRKLLEESHSAVRQAHFDLIWAHARKPAAGFYEKFGWEVVSEEYVIPTAGPHFRMICRL